MDWEQEDMEWTAQRPAWVKEAQTILDKMGMGWTIKWAHGRFKSAADSMAAATAGLPGWTMMDHLDWWKEEHQENIRLQEEEREALARWADVERFLEEETTRLQEMTPESGGEGWYGE